MTVLLRWARKFVVDVSWRFSTLLKASRRMRDCSSMYCKLRVLLLSSCCRRLCTDLKKDSWVEGCAGWADVLLGAARMESLGGVLILGRVVLAASSRGRLMGGATIVLLVLEELD